jgi:hypothetical protein
VGGPASTLAMIIFRWYLCEVLVSLAAAVTDKQR